MKRKLLLGVLIFLSVIAVIVSSNAVLGGAQAGNTYQLDQSRNYIANGNETVKMKVIRRIYIVSANTKVDSAVSAEASKTNCTEISQGIPPALKGIVTEAMLPYVYEELAPDVVPIIAAIPIVSTDKMAGDVTGTYDNTTISNLDIGKTTLKVASPLSLFNGNLSISGIDISDKTNLKAASPITLTDDTIGLSKNLIIVPYTFNVGAGNLATTTDKQTLHFGCLPGLAPQATAALAKTYIPRLGYIKSAYIMWNAGTAGTAESFSMYIRKNNSSDTLIATVANNLASKEFINTNLNISVSVGDYIEIKIICPTWATNPANVRVGGIIYVEAYPG